MNILIAAIPQPDPLPMPAPPWLLWALLILTFFIHLLAMNFVLGGSILAALGRMRTPRRGADEPLSDHERLSRWIGRAMPTMIATTVTFGVAPLLFVQTLYGRLFFVSAVLMAWIWFAVVPLVIVAYYGAYTISFGKNHAPRFYAAIAAVMALIFISVAFIYSNNMSLMLRAERFLPMYVADGSGVQLNTADPTLVPRYLHMLLGAIAVAGLIVALYGATRKEDEAAHGAWAVRRGALWFVGATVLNLILGVWWLGVLPREVLLRFMGRSGWATGVLLAGILLSFVSLVLMLGGGMAGADRRDARDRLVKLGAAATAGTLLAMIFARDEVRRGMMVRAGFEQTTWIEPQWGVIVLFLVLLVAGLAATVWMVMLLAKGEGARA